MTSSLVSVIIPTYNRPEFLRKCVESVIVQTYRNLEIIVINDGGVDVSNVINSASENLRVRYIVLSNNQGMAVARNTGLRVSNGTYIAYLDDDDIYYPQHIERLVSVLEQKPFAVAYSDACRAHLKWGDDEYTVVGRDRPYSFEFDADQLFLKNQIPTLCIMHRRDCLEKTGYFDESLNAHEDWDLWIRMSQQYPFFHVKEVTCEFSWREDGSTTTSSLHLAFVLTRLRIYDKYRAYVATKPALLIAQLAAHDRDATQLYRMFHQHIMEVLKKSSATTEDVDSFSHLIAKTFPDGATLTNAQARLIATFMGLLSEVDRLKKTEVQNRTIIARLTTYQNRVQRHPLYRLYQLLKLIVGFK